MKRLLCPLAVVGFSVSAYSQAASHVNPDYDKYASAVAAELKQQGRKSVVVSDFTTFENLVAGELDPKNQKAKLEGVLKQLKLDRADIAEGLGTRNSTEGTKVGLGGPSEGRPIGDTVMKSPEKGAISKGEAIQNEINKVQGAINAIDSGAPRSNVVGIVVGYSAAGHSESVIDTLNKMQAMAAKEFGLDSKSGMVLINGATNEGINQRLAEGINNGKFKPAGNPALFSTMGAVSVQAGEYGGMVNVNKYNYLADTKLWELKVDANSSSQNPGVVAGAAQKAGANVLWMAAEGGAIGVKETLEYITHHHDPKAKGTAYITLGVGEEPTNKAKDKGVRGTTELTYFLSQNPDLIDSMEKNKIKFGIVDSKSGRTYQDIREYLKSEDWKAVKTRVNDSVRQVSTEGFERKKKEIAELQKREDALKDKTDPKDKAQKKAYETQRLILQGEVTLVENFARGSGYISDLLGDLGKSLPAGHDKSLFTKMQAAGAATRTAAERADEGRRLDPAAAAAEARRSAK